MHQADDAVINVAGEIGGEMRGAKVSGELWQLGNRRKRLADATFARGWHVNPGVAIAVLARQGARVDPGRIERVGAGERGDLGALAGAGLEAPAVVFALHGFAIEPAGGERNAAMRAEIAHGEDGAVVLAAEQERDAEEQSGPGLTTSERRGTQTRVPVAEDQLCGWAGGDGRWDLGTHAR